MLAWVSALSINAYALQPVDKRFTQTESASSVQYEKHEKQESAGSNVLGVALYEPNYFMPFHYTRNTPQAIYGNNTPNQQALSQDETKVQLSFLVPIWKDILGFEDTSVNFGYTQTMFWQTYVRSEYFREVDYEPSIFLRTPLNHHVWLSIGAIHQSNGRGGSFERSWNRVYADVSLSGAHWMISVKPWVLIFKDNTSDLYNPDIRRYLGNGRILLAVKWHRYVLSFMSRNTIQSNFKRGAQALTGSVYIRPHVYLYVQAFNGYGQSLIEYNHRTTAFSVGIALNDVI